MLGKGAYRCQEAAGAAAAAELEPPDDEPLDDEPLDVELLDDVPAGELLDVLLDDSELPDDDFAELPLPERESVR
jgi:hypothetical protein